MRRREFIVGVGAAAWPGAIRSQTRSVPVVGILTNTSPADVRVWILPKALGALGYVEGQKIRYEFGLSDGQPERLPDLGNTFWGPGLLFYRPYPPPRH